MIIQYTQAEKQELARLLGIYFEKSGLSRNKFAVSVDLTAADVTNVLNGKYLENAKLVGDRRWVRIARLVGFEKNAAMRWKTAKTEVLEFITAQLSGVQAFAMTGILIDAPGIGKTYAAREYVQNHKNAFYLNCSATPAKREFMRAVAKMIGVDDTGSIKSQFEEALYILSQLELPLVVIDEAGDLDNACILLLKRMYNELEGRCGIYLIGSDGLRRKIQRGIRAQVQGYTEFFSRFGNKYSAVFRAEDGVDARERRQRLKIMGASICKANGITDTDMQEEVLHVLKEGDLRGVTRAIKKLRIKENILLD